MGEGCSDVGVFCPIDACMKYMDSTVRESSTRQPQCRHYRSTYATCFQHTPTTPKHLRTMDRLACTSHVSIPLRVSVWDSASQAASSLQQDDQLTMGARRRCLQRAVSQPATESHQLAKAQSVEGIERGGEGREVGDSSLIDLSLSSAPSASGGT